MKMNDSEKRYHQMLLETMDPKDIKCQKRIDFMNEVGIFWNMDFVMKDLVVDVKGRNQRESTLKTKMWEVLGDRPLKVVHVFKNTTRVQTRAVVHPDPVKIRALIARLQRNLEKIETQQT